MSHGASVVSRDLTLVVLLTMVSSKCHFSSLFDGYDIIIDLHICMAMPIFTVHIMRKFHNAQITNVNKRN